MRAPRSRRMRSGSASAGPRARGTWDQTNGVEALVTAVTPRTVTQKICHVRNGAHDALSACGKPNCSNVHAPRRKVPRYFSNVGAVPRGKTKRSDNKTKDALPKIDTCRALCCGDQNHTVKTALKDMKKARQILGIRSMKYS